MAERKRPVNAEEILDAIREKVRETENDKSAHGAWLEAFELVMFTPIIEFDHVTIVRCADCKWYKAEEGTRKGTCTVLERELVQNFYCANGAREDMVMPGVLNDVSWKL